MGMVMSSLVRQLTATQGLEGTNWKLRGIRNNGDLVFGANLLPHFVRARHAADACAENYDMCHVHVFLMG